MSQKQYFDEMNKTGVTKLATLYERINGLCKKKGVSIAKMCKDIKIPSSTIYELKSGKHSSLSSKTALKISNYFDVSVGYLYETVVVNTESVYNAVMNQIEQKEKPPTMDGRVFELITICNQLTDENLLKAADYIRYLLSTQK